MGVCWNSRVRLEDVPESVPLILRPKAQASLLVIAPPTSTEVSAPVVVLRLNVPSPCSVVVSLRVNRQLTPATATLNAPPLIKVLILVMSGSIPSNPKYLICHGNDAARIVASPPEQFAGAPTVALVM